MLDSGIFLKAPANEETLFPEIFLGCANEQEAKKKKMFCFLAAQTRKHLPRKQDVFENIQKHLICTYREANFAAATNVACARKREKQCFRNNVSSFVESFTFGRRSA